MSKTISEPMKWFSGPKSVVTYRNIYSGKLDRIAVPKEWADDVKRIRKLFYPHKILNINTKLY